MRRETLYEIYQRSPEECLQAMMDRTSERTPYSHPNGDAAFLWQSLRGKNEKTVYGSFKWITKKMLEGRQYRIEFWDGQPSIFWLDVVHNPRTYKSEPIEVESESGATHVHDV